MAEFVNALAVVAVKVSYFIAVIIIIVAVIIIKSINFKFN